MGSEFRSLPQELEDYYSLYFLERSIVVNFKETWQTSWDAKVAALGEVGARSQSQMVEYNKCIAALGEGNCDEYNLDDEFKAFADCLASTFSFYSECLLIDPVLITYG